MIEFAKEEREKIYSFLSELGFEHMQKEQLGELMLVIGFEEDLYYDKIIFTQRIAHIYASNKGQYQIFLANDSVAKLSTQSRQLLFALFRKYHQHKIRQQIQTQFIKERDGMTLPDAKDINDVIKFQKQMYSMFKDIMPQLETTSTQVLSKQPANITNNSTIPIIKQQMSKHNNNDFSYFTNPFIHEYQSYSNSFYDQFMYKDTNQIKHSQLFNERQSAFKKGGQFDKSITSKTEQAESNFLGKCSQPFYNPYQGQYPSKKQKTDFNAIQATQQVTNTNKSSLNLKNNKTVNMTNDLSNEQTQIWKIPQSNSQTTAKETFKQPAKCTHIKKTPTHRKDD